MKYRLMMEHVGCMDFVAEFTNGALAFKVAKFLCHSEQKQTRVDEVYEAAHHGEYLIPKGKKIVRKNKQKG